MYYIMEIQNNNGNFAHLVHTAETRNEAESVYHTVLAAAAISAISTHSVVMVADTGIPLMHQSYVHEAPRPADVENEEAEA